MIPRNRLLLVAVLTLGAVACDDAVTNTEDTPSLSGAFGSSLVAFDNTPTSFGVSAGASAEAWTPPRGPHGPGDGLAGPGHPGGGMMGGGLGGPFLGGPFLGFGRGEFGDGRGTSNCAYNATSQRLECPAETRNGVTVTRSVAYATAGGAAQQAFDSLTTDRIDTRVTVKGTMTRRDSATTAVDHAGGRTVTGLAKGSTKVTVNGAAAGRETTTGKDSLGAFTAVRVQGDTTKNVVIPVSAGALSSPASGSVIRVMSVTVTRGGTATSSSRREVVTFNGTDTATVAITKDGATTTCKLPLKGRQGPPSCK